MSPPSGGTRELVLTNLFGLHGGRVLSAEAELSDGHIVQDDVEVFGPLEQLSADQQRHLQAKEGRIFRVCWGCRDSLIWSVGYDSWLNVYIVVYSVAHGCVDYYIVYLLCTRVFKAP